MEEKLVYHYTNMQAFVGIVGNNSKSDGVAQKLTFWGTRYDSMNDPLDYMFASTVVLPKIKKSIEQMKELDDEESEDVESYPYIVSFSELRDSEFMWDHYKAGICLELDSNCFLPWIQEKGKINAFWDKCEYAEEDEIDEAFIKKWKESKVYLKNLNDMARHACVYIKRKAFEQEREWRLYIADHVLSHFKANGESCRMEQPQNVKVKCVRDNDIILYKEFLLPAEALKGIIVNDRDWTHFRKVKKHIEVVLRENGFCLENIAIKQTNCYPLK